jgi:lambda repressor-like predicted transcriptional regulator
MSKVAKKKAYRILEIINRQAPQRRRTELRKILCSILGYSDSTLYMKMRAQKNSKYKFFPEEEIIIAKTLGVPIEEIFPQSSEVVA